MFCVFCIRGPTFACLSYRKAEKENKDGIDFKISVFLIWLYLMSS
jgi:hypothetical protein